MDIKQAIERNIQVVTPLDRPYILKISGSGNVEVSTPVNMRVLNVNFPMRASDVDFEYAISTNTQTRSLGQYKFDNYFPIGHVLDLMGIQVTITSYSEPIKNEFGNGLYYLSVNVTFNAFLENERITNDSIEANVINSLNTIVAANEVIHQNLLNYNHNVIDLIGTEAADIISADSVIKSMIGYEKNIIQHFSSVMSFDISQNDDSDLHIDASDFVEYMSANHLHVKYYGNEYNIMNSEAFVAWLYSAIMNSSSIDYGKLSLLTQNELNTYFAGSARGPVNASIIIYTPSICTYNILIYFDSANSGDGGRLNISAKFAILRKDLAAGSVNNITFKEIPGDGSISHKLGEFFYNISAHITSTDTANQYNIVLYELLRDATDTELTGEYTTVSDIDTTGRFGNISFDGFTATI